MNKLYFYPLVASDIEKLSEALPQACLLTGKTGVGLFTIAKLLAQKRTLLDEIIPQLLTKTSTVPQISINTIRELYDRTKTKNTKSALVIIDDADTMTVAAQNAFLKLLEEPNDSVHCVLTSHHPERLLPTVRSRLQTHHIRPITSQQTREMLSTYSGLSTTKQSQVLFIADGLPAEITRLVSDDVYFETVSERVRAAKALIEASSSERIVRILSMKKTERSDSLKLLNAIAALLEKYPDRNGVGQLERILDAEKSIRAGANPRLQLARSML